MNWTFADPWFLLTALAAPLVVAAVWIKRRRKQPSVIFPMFRSAKRVGATSWKVHLRWLPTSASIVAIILLAIVLARPQSVSEGEDVWTEGIDLVLVLDISASMLAQDFSPDRVGAAKQVAAEFISSRPNDRIGLVLFAKQAFTQCPVTIDHTILLELLSGVQIGLADPDNTAIGSALAAGLNRLKDSAAKSRVIVLLTDGENNYGLPPMTAAEAAQALGIRVYTIGVGTRGTAPYPTRDIFGRTVMQQVPVNIDEPLLQEIAQMTGGRYFRATDNSKLVEIFAEIDKMEKTRIEIHAFRRFSEKFYPFAKVALGLILIGLFLSLTVLWGMV